MVGQICDNCHPGGENKMNQRLIYLYICLLIPFLISAQNESVLSVKYLSAENVYITGGKLDGINLGDQYAVIRDAKSIADIEVIYVADHSASCKVLKKEIGIQIGDRLKLLKKGSTELRKQRQSLL